MVLSSEWSQVEVIDLINDGTNLSGLGFILVGGRSTGVGQVDFFSSRVTLIK